MHQQMLVEVPQYVCVNNLFTHCFITTGGKNIALLTQYEILNL